MQSATATASKVVTQSSLPLNNTHSRHANHYLGTASKITTERKAPNRSIKQNQTKSNKIPSGFP